MIDPPVTTTGMLPIIQAPADDSDTLITVINSFVDIEHTQARSILSPQLTSPCTADARNWYGRNPNVRMLLFSL